MKKLGKLFIFSIFAILFVSLEGCVNDIVKNTDITVDSNSGQGYVAFSAMCEGAQTITMIYHVADFNPARFLVEENNANHVDISCKAPGLQYFMLKLPTSKYSITDFVTGSYETKNFQDIYFRAIPGRVLYLGRLYINAISETFAPLHFTGRKFISDKPITMLERYKIYMIDKSNDDIPYFTNKYKNIPRDLYVLQGFNSGGDKLMPIPDNRVDKQNINNVGNVPLTISTKNQPHLKMINSNDTLWVVPK